MKKKKGRARDQVSATVRTDALDGIAFPISDRRVDDHCMRYLICRRLLTSALPKPIK